MSTSLAAILIAVCGLSANNSLPWNSDYGEALENAKEEEKQLLIVIEEGSGTEQGVLQDDQELRELTESYTLCRIDSTSEYGKGVAAVFHAKEFPFAAVIDKDGKRVVEKWTGQRTVEQWRTALSEQEEPSGQQLEQAARNVLNNITRGRRRSSRSCYT